MHRFILVFVVILFSFNPTIVKAEGQTNNTNQKSLEERRFELEQEKFEHDKKMKEKKLDLDQQNSDGFLQKNFGVILTFIISLATIIVSVLQLIAKKEETKKAQIQKDKEISIAEITNERDWNYKAVEFVAQNQETIFGNDKEKGDKIAKVMLATFPPAVTNALFQKLEFTAETTEAKQVWITNQEVAVKQILVRVDGFYYHEKKNDNNYSTKFLHFNENGTVVGASVSGKRIDKIAHKVAEWLIPNENGIHSEGHYIIKGRSIKFSLTSETGTIDYEGEIRGENELFLNVHSHINGYKSSSTYYFYKL